MEEKVLKSAEVLFDLAYSEDIGAGDITTDNFIPLGEIKTARLVAKEEGIVAGLPVVEMVFRRFDENFEWKVLLNDGEKVVKGDVIAEFSGSYRAILSGERIALNFLQRMSGIATYSHRFTELTRGTKVEILDTRKTLPGYRYLD